MLLQTSLLLCIAIPTFAHVIDYRAVNSPIEHPNLPLQVCGTPPPSDDLRQSHSFLRSNPEARLQDQAAASPINVQVYVHFVTTSDQAPRFSTATRNKLVTSQVFLSQPLKISLAHFPLSPLEPNSTHNSTTDRRPQPILQTRQHLLPPQHNLLHHPQRLGHRRQQHPHEALPPPRHLRRPKPLLPNQPLLRPLHLQRRLHPPRLLHPPHRHHLHVQRTHVRVPGRRLRQRRLQHPRGQHAGESRVRARVRSGQDGGA